MPRHRKSTPRQAEELPTMEQVKERLAKLKDNPFMKRLFSEGRVFDGEPDSGPLVGPVVYKPLKRPR